MIRVRFKCSRIHSIISPAFIQGDITEALLPALTELLPESLPLYHADTITDKPEKFFASEVSRDLLFSPLNLIIERRQLCLKCRAMTAFLFLFSISFFYI